MILNGNAEQAPGKWGSTNNLFCNGCTGTQTFDEFHSGQSAIKVFKC